MVKTGRKRYVPWSRRLIVMFFSIAYRNRDKHSQAPEIVKAIFIYP